MEFSTEVLNNSTEKCKNVFHITTDCILTGTTKVINKTKKIFTSEELSNSLHFSMNKVKEVIHLDTTTHYISQFGSQIKEKAVEVKEAATSVVKRGIANENYNNSANSKGNNNSEKYKVSSMKVITAVVICFIAAAAASGFVLHKNKLEQKKKNKTTTEEDNKNKTETKKTETKRKA